MLVSFTSLTFLYCAVSSQIHKHKHPPTLPHTYTYTLSHTNTHTPTHTYAHRHSNTQIHALFQCYKAFASVIPFSKFIPSTLEWNLKTLKSENVGVCQSHHQFETNLFRWSRTNDPETTSSSFCVGVGVGVVRNDRWWISNSKFLLKRKFKF